MASPPAEKPAASPRIVIKRTVHCTHTSMDRAFSDSDTAVECSRCGQAEFGWIYVCTADHVSDDSAFYVKTETERGVKPQDAQLNEWVVRAIEEGHYTEEQIEKLRAQKARVWESIVNGDDISTHIRQKIHDHKYESQTQADNKKLLLRHLALSCNLRMCYYCFPAGRDRSWISLNEVCAEMDHYNPVHSSLSQIPDSEVRRFPLAQSCKVKPVEENEHNKATAAATTADDMHHVPGEEQVCQDEEAALEVAAADPTSGSEHDVNVLMSTFGNYKKQDLGTPRKLSRQIKPVGVSDENTPPQHSQALPIRTRKPEWASKDSENPSLVDAANVTEV